MKSQHITMRFAQPMGFAPVGPERFEIRPNPKWPRLSALLMKALSRMGMLGSWWQQEMRFREVTIDRNQAASKIILMAKEQFMRYHYGGGRPEKVLIGHKQFAELIHECPPNLGGSFSFSLDLTLRI